MNTSSTCSSQRLGPPHKACLQSQPQASAQGRRCYPSPPASRASSNLSSPQSPRDSAIPPSRIPSSGARSPTPSIDPLKRPVESPRRSRIEVASLLADPQPRSYCLEVVQQPQKAAEFRAGNLSRLPITPTIIVRLVIRDASGNSVIPEGELPFLIAHLSLYSEDGRMSLDMGSQIGQGNQSTILYGNLVSSVDVLQDLQGDTGMFFLFPDVSVRWVGRYQLGITLTKISSPGPTGELNLADRGTQLSHIRTNAFEVLPHVDHVAAPQSRLMQAFVRQGARINFLG